VNPLVKETEAYIRVKAWLKKYGYESWLQKTVGSLRVYFGKRFSLTSAETLETRFAPGALLELDEFLREHQNDVNGIEYSIVSADAWPRKLGYKWVGFTDEDTRSLHGSAKRKIANS